MKYKFDYFTLLSFLFFASPMLSIAQNLPPMSGKYTRSSITPIYIKHSDSRLSIFNFVDSVKISDKYDQNVIGNNTMDVVFKMISDTRKKYYELVDRSANAKNLPKEEQEALSKNLSEVSKQLAFEDSIRSFQIVAKLRSSKIPNRVLSSLLIDNKLGYMTLAKLEERALYDASDSDVLQANNSERKMASIKDRAVSMLNGVYFWVYDANEYKITDDEKDSRLKTHSLRGGVYLVKLDMDLLSQNGQFENLIFQEFSTSKLKAFKEFNFPVKVIFRKDFSTSTSNYEIDYSGTTGALISSLGKEQKQKSEVKYIFKQDDQIQKELVSGTVSSANETFTANYEPFRVKSSVFATSPIRVKIGKKEELEIDHLFKVSEFRLDKSGNPFEKNVGWLRVKKVSDNRKKADGKMEPSVFYKVFSKGVDKGMKVQYVHETGVVIGAGFNGLPDNIFSGPMVNFDYITKLYPGLRVGLNFGGFTELESPRINIPALKLGNNLRFKGRNVIGELTLQKIIQFNILEITPYVGGYVSSIRMTDLSIGGIKINATDLPEILKLAYNEYGGLAGIKFGINFGKYTQLNLGYKAGFTAVSELKHDDDKEGIEIIGSLFNSPSNVSIGLRLTGF